MEDHGEMMESNEEEALTELDTCRSLMEKLAQQGYDYVYDSADLALVKQHQKAIAAAAHFSETAQHEVESRFPGKGFVWLTFYQENLADVERRGAVNPKMKLVKNALIILVAFGFPLFFVPGSPRFTGQTSSLSPEMSVTALTRIIILLSPVSLWDLQRGGTTEFFRSSSDTSPA